MRSVRRQLQQIWYCTVQSETDGLDPPTVDLLADDGDGIIEFQERQYLNTSSESEYNGEPNITYNDPESMWANVSPASGMITNYEYGLSPDYTHVITTEWRDCPITMTTALFVDKEPEFDEWHNPLYDYVVKRIEHNRHQTVIYVKHVEIGGMA